MMGFLTNLFSGSILGMLGSVGSGIVAYLQEKQKNKHELDVLSAQKGLIEATGASQVTLETLKVLGASYDADKASYSNVDASYVDQVRGLVRPILTTYLTLLASYIAVYAVHKVGLSILLMEKIAEYSVYSSFELTGISIGWYFGSRGLQRFKSK